MANKQENSFFSYIEESVKSTGRAAAGSVNEVRSLSKLLQKRFTAFHYSHPLVYLLDYTTGKYLFVSRDSHTQIHIPPEKIKDGGFEFLAENYHPQDLQMFSKQIFKDRQMILKDIPVADHRNIMFTYNYRFRNGKGEYVNLFSQNVNLQTNENGHPILSLGLVININHFEHSNPIVHLTELVDEQNATREILQKKSYYLREEYQVFSKREIEILLHIADGLSSKQIADKLFISEHTVINHKRNMQHKSNTPNAAGLISFAFRNRLL